MTWLKRFSYLLLLLLLLLAAVVAYVTMTHGGMQRIFSIGKNAIQGELSWRESSGKLIGPAAVADLSFVALDGTSVTVKGVQFDWKPGQLVSGKLRVDELQLSGVEIHLPAPVETPQDTGAEPFQLQDLALPIEVDVNRVAITDLSVYPPGASDPIVINEILLTAGAEDDKLKLVELSVRAPSGELTVKGTVDTSAQWPVSLEQRWQYKHPQFGDFRGNGSVVGVVENLQLLHQISGGIAVELDVVVTDAIKNLQWRGTVNAGSDDLGNFSEALTGVPFTFETRTEGSLQKFNATGAFTTRHDQTGAVSGTYAISGTPDKLSVSSAEVALTETNLVLNADGEVTLANLESDVTLRWQELAVPLIGQPVLVKSPAGELKFSGVPDNFTMTGKVDLLQEQAGNLQLNLLAAGNGKSLSIDSLSLSSEDSETQLDTTALIDLENQSVDAKGDWKKLRWPLIGEPLLVSSPAGEFTIQGPVSGYTVSAALELEATAIPAGRWQLAASGDAESLSSISLKAETLGGVVEAGGVASWSPQTDFDLQLQGSGVNPGVQWKEFEGSIGFKSSVQGTIAENGPDVIVRIDSLSGDYRQQALSGGGLVTVKGNNVQIDDLAIKAGQAMVSGAGTVGETLNLQWQLDAPALARLHPSLNGAVNTRGKLAGSLEEPAAEFTFDLSDYQSAGIGVQQLSGSGIIDLTGATGSSIKLSATDLLVADRRFDTVTLQGSGKPEEHKLDVSLEGTDATINLSAAGGIKSEQWLGKISRLDLLKTGFGDWKLTRPIDVAAAEDSASVKSFCLQSEPTTLCGDGSWNAVEGVVAALDLEQLLASRFSEYLPSDISIEAGLGGTVKLRYGASGELNAAAEFTIPGGEIGYESAGVPVTATLGTSAIKANVEGDTLKSTVDLDLGDIGMVNVDATVNELSGRQRLRGAIKTDLQDMSLAGIATPELQSIDGKLRTSLKLGGTAVLPIFTGEVRLTEFTAEVPSVAMKIFDGAMDVVSDGKGGLRIDGSARSGEGDINLDGLFNQSSGKLELNLKGDRFQIANTNRQQAEISPDMQIKMDSSDISVTGDLDIPSAYIKAGGEGSTLRESSDIRVIDAEGEMSEKSATSQVRLKMNVTLGDDIRVAAGQFDGALAGGLLIEQQPGLVPTGSGAIDVVSGDFLVYGQKLTMERGRILFGGGPVDNPALEMDVARDVPKHKIKAGARIRGTAQAPLLELQSDPQQTDANTLSLIVLGELLDNPGASYTLGKFITPDIYVSYGIDLLDKINVFNLKYNISDRLSLIASYSDKTSADLVYTLER
ncbi:hypothetical protein AB833_24590 [Chromatiales bacterium (ex Bugula neritina AB1)]|nr:hypothetical protein AB833_24590 [Chromatiales bacterium (ex Bugula neritina AB1)]